MPASLPSFVVPQLETEHLLLRGHLPSDLAPFVAMWAEPAFYRFLSPQPLSQEEVWTKMLRHTGLWPLLGYGYWAIEEKSTGAFIGAVGFADWRRIIEPALNGIPEMGWVLAPQVQGRGYATEAARAALSWEAAHLAAPRLVCLIHPENLASRRMAEKNGYQEYARTIYKGQPGLLLERWP
ncbi:GNAT family N-acetyltransferase [Hymenobacter psychrotolerans]|uniref:Protein N-acetyltransferase, RimJ/RimL family n=1 Tax=Hymenobacter psychrotolerans DSM 18569 TaxID=1121959 RepID=A0A1M6P5H5_9BACT|nr:GNAT family N-acetyltransferase [Hymenobacter psychrotolerans]SHK03219.1 Protein N-acetyltransferase, RimJ/RimL family [Hymenobacter psychrotolerans DSM 18569]